MVKKITNKKILAEINAVRDDAVKKALLREDGGFCSVQFFNEHEKAFRALIPDYYDGLKEAFSFYYENYVKRDMFMACLCLQTGVVSKSDFRTVTNFATADIDPCALRYGEISSAKLFRASVLKEKNGDKKLVEFVDGKPEYLEYFLSLMFSVRSEIFAEAIAEQLKSAKMQDGVRINIFEAILLSSDAAALLYYLNKIDEENYYRFKALTEAAVTVGDYTAILQPKELVPVLRDAALGNTDKYFDSDFKRTYSFIKAYARTHSAKEVTRFARDLLERGGNRSRWALLNILTEEEINKTYADRIFSRQLTAEDLSFFIYRIKAVKMSKATLAQAFENLFAVFVKMDKVSYHYKTDEDINFARDLYRSAVATCLGEIAACANNAEYVARMDALYDSLKEEAQANYLKAIGNKTKLNLRKCAIQFLKTDNYRAVQYFNEKKIKLTYDEAVLVSDYLKSKKEAVKSKIIKTFLTSPDCDKIANYLISQKEDYKKSAGEEMKESSGKIDKKKLVEDKSKRYYWERDSVFTVDKPSAEINRLAEDKCNVSTLKPLGYKHIKRFFDAIKIFIDEHRDYEYANQFGEGLAHFGSTFYRLKDCADGDNGFTAYPLGEELKKLIGGFSQEEIANALILTHCVQTGNKNLYLAVCDNRLFSDAGKSYDYVKSFEDGSSFMSANPYRIMESLRDAVIRELLEEEYTLQVLSALTQKNALRNSRKNSNNYRWSDHPSGIVHALVRSDDKCVIEQVVSLECAFVQEELTEAFEPLLTVKAYEYGIITASLARYMLLKNGNLYIFCSPTSQHYVMRADYKYPKFRKLLEEFTENALATEFARGSLQTQYSEILGRCGRITGVDKFVKAIAALRGLTWSRSAYGSEKNEVLSSILKATVKASGDTYEQFTALLETYKITNDELLRATLFNPEFADYAARYLQIPDLKLAVFWFTAHLNECLYGDEKERRAEQIKEFSSISYEDFKDGAFDYDWYAEMVRKVDEKTLKRIYADAKYVTVGGLHKRAQRFFDAVNGRIDKSECTEKMKTTRNKDYCLVYSLIPIRNQEDLYERYATLADFARESKQFGAQRQLSERRTVDIALENLARSAGYANADIFMFEMESQTPVDIYKDYEVEDVTVTPYIDEKKFKIALSVKRNGKTLASIPSKYSKNETVVYLREQVKLLNQKMRRIINSFESCMCSRAPFTAEQLRSMSRERTIAVTLSKLALLADGKLCVYDGELTDLNGNAVDANEIYIAHPVELKKLGLLQDAIAYVAINNIRQPFKQVLREIYLKTDLELTQDEVLRFKGYEVDLKKCISALKGKGWGVSEDIGLRKVYYRSDTVAAIFRKCDFLYTADFDNVNRELHGIFFLKRKTEEVIPIKDVDDVTFSETLRDVDLMISISSKVIYDFELAMSTVEMRQEVLKSIVGILSLDNVSFLKDNIKVQGHYGTYVINIRTGLVFKEGKGNLALDTVYSVDKPILLDFVDEDPMTADIISKAIILASDEAIKDSSILREIKD